MTAWMTWWYHDADGRRVFQHYRKTRTPTSDDPRCKEYGYRLPVVEVIGGQRVLVDWDYRKPLTADRLVFRLPMVLAHRDQCLVLTEGERCAVAALKLGVLATTHHGGAGKFTQAMAESLARHRGRIVLVADNDPAGAYDVVRRFDLLRAVGLPAKRLRVREVTPTHPGADLRDHLEAGYRLSDLRAADVDELREVAATVTGSLDEGSWPDGLTPEERRQIATWRPVGHSWPARGRTPARNAGVLR
ncbi:hypothetical protein ISU10_11215 [Nocardioides agariphilus]|uniref:Toprim domain-containing protein n=1 Tax=Nocardioides agariphilus TaxID=433664 RepID=A0A930VPB3_9ACTN|nr:toprim domain-containing protein [Nocardioides agariphilus]MBF4768336.1 hypothetical protein [Nocardioides agariphilus]